MRCARKIETGDITPLEAARLMGQTLAQFEYCLPSLLDRGFPPADPTTGNYALDAITVWQLQEAVSGRSDIDAGAETARRSRKVGLRWALTVFDTLSTQRAVGDGSQPRRCEPMVSGRST